MTFEEFYKLRKKTKIVIQCETIDEYIDVLSEEYKFITTHNQQSSYASQTREEEYIKSKEGQWKEYTYETCRTNESTYGNCSMYKRDGTKIIKFKNMIRKKDKDEIIEF